MSKLWKLLIVLAVLLSGGCQSVRKSAYLAVVSKADGSGEVIYFDEDLKRVAAISCGKVSEAVESDGVVYLSSDGSNWQGYYVGETKKANRFTSLDQPLVYGRPDGLHLCYQDQGTLFYMDGRGEMYERFIPQIIYSNKRWLCVIDTQNLLRVFDLDDIAYWQTTEQLGEQQAIAFMEIQGEICLVSSSGVSVIKDGHVEMTYVYPVQFEEIENAFGGRIFVYEGGEKVVYRLGFSEHFLTLELEKEERYYREIDLDQLVAEETANGGRLIWFTEAEN